MKAKNKKQFWIFYKEQQNVRDYTIVNHVGNVYHFGYEGGNGKIVRLYQYSVMDKHKTNLAVWRTLTETDKRKLLKREINIFRDNARMNLNWHGKELATIRDFKSIPQEVMDFINYNTSLDNDSTLFEIRLRTH